MELRSPADVPGRIRPFAGGAVATQLGYDDGREQIVHNGLQPENRQL